MEHLQSVPHPVLLLHVARLDPNLADSDGRGVLEHHGARVAGAVDDDHGLVPGLSDIPIDCRSAFSSLYKPVILSQSTDDHFLSPHYLS